MREFAKLLETLALTPSRNRKIDAMTHYFKQTPDPDRGIALAILTGDLSFKNVKSSTLKKTVLEHVDPHLFQLSYDYVGDLGETIALIWPYQAPENERILPLLFELITHLNEMKKSEIPAYVESLLSAAETHERWAIVKTVTGGLRVGVSARLARTALSKMNETDLQEIEEIWHGQKIPYQELFAWLEGRSEKPEVHPDSIFHPLMLSNPIDEDKDFEKLTPADFTAEWKWDGIRVQLVMGDEKRMFSRTGDDISHTFPDLIERLSGRAVLDGELLVGQDFDPGSFNDLQQRLNKKNPDAKQMKQLPAFVRVYDILFDGQEDLRALELTERRERLERWFAQNPQDRLDVSDQLAFTSWDDLAELRRIGGEEHGHEGVMIKLKTSPYVPGRPKGLWFKWKRDPHLVDAVLMYAQRGHGKRSSFYSDYTFGLWKGNEIVPIGKAYFGFTDEELKEIDKWVRKNTINRFGPVREVKKELVFEVAFDSAQTSARHKSGVALRFPRIHRIRWDKPAQEADRLGEFKSRMSI